MKLFEFMKKEKLSIAEVNDSQEPNVDISEPLSTEDVKKEFDLNIEKILENWDIYHAVREIISNAIDEQILSGTQDIKIYKDEMGRWHITDFGRGINYHHLTQNENEEKLNNDKLIGRFGVGLKDALATLYRNNIKVVIKSKYGIITLKESAKIGFDDIITLHANILPAEDTDMSGTDFCLEGCPDEEIEKAKSLFLIFSDNNILESTEYGDIIEKKNSYSNIYINGVKVSEEQNFLFSYNITSLNTKLKKALNRERSNVGRTAYTDRIKSILMDCNDEKVIDMLIEDLQGFGRGIKHDELNWQDIQMHVSSKLREKDEKTTFVSADVLEETPGLVDRMKRDGYNTVVVPNNIIEKMEDYNKGVKEKETFTTPKQYLEETRSKFKPTYIEYQDLSEQEKGIFDQTNDILELIGGMPDQVKELKIVDKIYETELHFETVGLWQPQEKRILVKRCQLQSLNKYAGTLLHECSHAKSGASDVSRDFEAELTRTIGFIVSNYFDYKKGIINTTDRIDIFISDIMLAILDMLKRENPNIRISATKNAIEDTISEVLSKYKDETN